MIGPPESRPDGASGVVAVDAPVTREGTNDVESVVPTAIIYGWAPRSAVVRDFDPDVVARADLGVEGEGAAWQAGVAVKGSVGREFGGTEDHIVCHGAVTQ